jgi:DNA-binding NarL/FixJ family response regulator
MSQDELGTGTGHRSMTLPSPGGPTGRDTLSQAARAPEPRRPALDLRPCASWPPTPLVQVLLCEDQEVFRLGLRSVLEAQPDMAVVAETADLSEALEMADGPGTWVVVVRQELVDDSTLPLLRGLCQRGVGVLLLAETRSGSRTALMDLLQAGVRGCLPRRAGAQRLVDAVRALARHETALDSAVTSQLVRYLTGEGGQPAQEARPLDRLTERQRDVAELVAQGLSNEEIAGRLFLSPATVKSHLTTVMRRLDVRTRTQLAILVNRGDSPAA